MPLKAFAATSLSLSIDNAEYYNLLFTKQVKDVLFEPVRKTQDAMFFIKTSDGMWMPCGPKQPGAVQTTMQDLAAKGLAAKVHTKNFQPSICF